MKIQEKFAEGMNIRLEPTASETGFTDHDCLIGQALIDKHTEEITDISFYPCE